MARSLLSAPGAAPSAKASHSPSQAATRGVALLLTALALDPRRFTPFSESLLYSLLRRKF